MLTVNRPQYKSKPERDVACQSVACKSGTLYLAPFGFRCPGNAPEDRELTARLYGGDDRVRIRQELLLGVGGLRALRALGIKPSVLHLNEGHSAFAVLEKIRMRMEEEGLTFEQSAVEVSRQTCFTTHTPVPAGMIAFMKDSWKSILDLYVISWVLVYIN